MQSHYLFLALDLARERVAEAERARLASLAEPAPSRVTRARRAVARVAIAIARAADETALDRRPTAA
jgi:hypothetical protein